MGKYGPRNTHRIMRLSREDLSINHGSMRGWPSKVTPGHARKLAALQPVSQMVKDGRVIVVDISYVDHGAIVTITVNIRDNLGEQL
jgi:hypothetical protein